MVRKKICKRCTSRTTTGYYCRDCNAIRNQEKREKRKQQKEAGTLPVMLTIRCLPQDAEAIRKNARDRGQSVNSYLVAMGRAGEV